MKYTYCSKKDEDGNIARYKCWNEEFKDEDTGEVVKIKRHQLIKINGVAVVFYSDSQLRAMTSEERRIVSLKRILKRKREKGLI